MLLCNFATLQRRSRKCYTEVMGKLRFLALMIFAGVLFAACDPREWKAKAGLQVQTDEVPASLFLDGKYLEKTPYINKEMRPGNYSLEIRPDNPALVPYQTIISLKKGVLTFVTWKAGTRPETSGGVIYEMEALKDPRDSQLSLTTIPDGAIIRVDDQAKGFAPVLVEHISAGEHSYEISLPSYETQKNTINVLEGFRMDVTVKLARQTFTNPTAAPSPSGSASPSATPSVLGVTTASPSAKPSSSPSPSPVVQTTTLPKPKVHIQPTKFLQDGKEVLRVRETPNAGANTIGYVPVGNEYPYLKEFVDGWYKISFDGKTGWVSMQYAQLME